MVSKCFFLNCKLSTNHRPRFTIHGGHYEECYQRMLIEGTAELLIQVPFDWFLATPVHVTVALGSMNKRGDLDNYLKGIIDLLVKARVVQDDSQQFISRMTIYRGKFTDDYSCRILVESEDTKR